MEAANSVQQRVLLPGVQVLQVCMVPLGLRVRFCGPVGGTRAHVVPWVCVTVLLQGHIPSLCVLKVRGALVALGERHTTLAIVCQVARYAACGSWVPGPNALASVGSREVVYAVCPLQ